NRQGSGSGNLDDDRNLLLKVGGEVRRDALPVLELAHGVKTLAEKLVAFSCLMARAHRVAPDSVVDPVARLSFGGLARTPLRSSARARRRHTLILRRLRRR